MTIQCAHQRNIYYGMREWELSHYLGPNLIGPPIYLFHMYIFFKNNMHMSPLTECT